MWGGAPMLKAVSQELGAWLKHGDRVDQWSISRARRGPSWRRCSEEGNVSQGQMWPRMAVAWGRVQ